jgi:hypothetical protein
MRGKPRYFFPMGKLRDLKKKLEGVTIEGQETELLKIVSSLEDTIVDMNTDQLMQGLNSKGESLGEYASAGYAEMKKTLNPAGVVDLKLEGDFHSGFFIEAIKFPVRIDSKDSKTNKLVFHYGENIFGLVEQNKNILSHDYIKERYQNYLRNIIKL